MINNINFKIIRNAASNFTGTSVNLVITFILTPIVISHLGLIHFGIWAIINSVVGYMGLLDLGLNTTLVKKTSEYHIRNDQGQLIRTINNILNLYFIIGFIIGLVIIIISFFIPHAFSIPSSEMELFTNILILVGLQTALSFPMSVWSGIIAGLQEFHIINAVGIISNITKAVLTIILLQLSFGLFSLVLSSFMISISVWLFYYFLCKKRLNNITIKLFSLHKKELKEIFRFSSSMVIWSVAGYSVHQLDKILIGIFLPISNVSIYDVGSKINIYSRSIIHNILSVIFPTASELRASGDVTKINQIYIKGTRYIFLAYSFVFASVLLFGKSFIELWLGSRFAGSVIIMQILVFSSLIQSHNIVAHVLLPGMNKLKVFSRVMLAYPIMILITMILFIKIFGLVGVTISILFTIIVLEGYFNKFIQKTFSSNWKIFIREIYLPTVLTLIPTVLVIIMLKRALYVYNWWHLIFYIAFFFILCVANFIFFVSTLKEKELFHLLLNRIIKFAKGS